MADKVDQAATRLVGKLDKGQEKIDKFKPDDKKDKKDKKPAGGYDDTPIKHSSPGYTVKFTFHRASNLPFADINTLSSDPYVHVTLHTSLPPRHSEDPLLTFRTRTIRRSTEPTWDAEWIVGNVPPSGFKLVADLFDEDPGDHDDRLGRSYYEVQDMSAFHGTKDEGLKIHKHKASKRAYMFRGCAAMFNRNVNIHGELFISAEVLGKTKTEHGGRVFTIGPCNWVQHYSPLIGRLAGTRDSEKGTDGKKTESYDFQANQIQLAGPVPEKLYHRYVEFRPFVKGMFTGKSLRGRLLNRALHHQHSRIYNYDGKTKYGGFEEPSREMTEKFLDLVHYDESARTFTYVITLNGVFRFTETGKQFGIDLLSKHTMHSDVDIYIAFSGEFFIRRLKKPYKPVNDEDEHGEVSQNEKDKNDGNAADDTRNDPQLKTADSDRTHTQTESSDEKKNDTSDEADDLPPNTSEKSTHKTDPSYFHLYIDNDSGTYRPNKDLLPVLKAFLKRSLPGLKITTMDCMGDKDKMDRLKDEQRKRHAQSAEVSAFVQDGGGDESSVSSSDESDLDRVEGDVSQARKERRDREKK